MLELIPVNTAPTTAAATTEEKNVTTPDPAAAAIPAGNNNTNKPTDTAAATTEATANSTTPEKSASTLRALDEQLFSSVSTNNLPLAATIPQDAATTKPATTLEDRDEVAGRTKDKNHSSPLKILDGALFGTNLTTPIMQDIAVVPKDISTNETSPQKSYLEKTLRHSATTILNGAIHIGNSIRNQFGDSPDKTNSIEKTPEVGNKVQETKRAIHSISQANWQDILDTRKTEGDWSKLFFQGLTEDIPETSTKHADGSPMVIIKDKSYINDLKTRSAYHGALQQLQEKGSLAVKDEVQQYYIYNSTSLLDGKGDSLEHILGSYLVHGTVTDFDAQGNAIVNWKAQNKFHLESTTRMPPSLQRRLGLPPSLLQNREIGDPVQLSLPFGYNITLPKELGIGGSYWMSVEWSDTIPLNQKATSSSPE